MTDPTVAAFPQTKVWVRTVHFVIARQLNVNSSFRGGQIIYPSLEFQPVRATVTDFSANAKDPGVTIFPSFVSAAGTLLVSQSIFYDGSTPPSCMFDNFTIILPASSVLRTRSYSDMILSGDANSAARFRSVRLRIYRSVCSLILFSASFHMLGINGFSETLLETPSLVAESN